MNKTIWVYIETAKNELEETSLEVLSEGCRLAEKSGSTLSAVMIGCGLERFAETVFLYGPKTLFAIETESDHPLQLEVCATLFADLIREHDPDVVLLGGTLFGNDLAAHVAAKVRTGLAKNCDKIVFSEKGILEQHRLCFENKVHAVVHTPDSRPQMATIEPGIMKIKKTAKKPDPAGQKIISVTVAGHGDNGSTGGQYLSFIPADPKTIDISDAPTIVAGGNGARDMEQFESVRELADCLGGAVAGSRAAVDNGCIGRERQIGQSGKTVSPDLLISCGISGAHAHTIGMKEAKTIIVINNDKNAPIHKMADLGVVGDMHEIIPELISRLKELKKSENADVPTDRPIGKR